MSSQLMILSLFARVPVQLAFFLKGAIILPTKTDNNRNGGIVHILRMYI